MDELALDDERWRAHWRARVARCRSRARDGDDDVERTASIEVRPSTRHGRGVYATKDFARGECVFIERPLRAMQSEENKEAATTCQQCFAHVNAVGETIGKRLLAKARRDDGFARKLLELGITLGDCEKLARGEATLPGSEAFAGPRAVACAGGCRANAYCSETCAQTAWEEYERLCCVGARGEATDKRALEEFYAHARETNDIFILAARCVANMCLRAKDAARRGIPHDDHDDAGDASTTAPSSSGKAVAASKEAVEDYARAPYAVIANAPWWECVAAPEECDDDVDAEIEFKHTLHALASDSLELLRHAWSDEASAFPKFFELDTYARLIGAFELNNLELVVESPVENYFLAIDSAPDGEEKRAAMKITQPLLDALDVDYDTPCLGTALFSVQSGLNHDCDPNAEPMKGEKDITGACVIVARRDIAAGEEITMSYLDDDSKSRDERQAALVDYGFICRCARCEEELRRTRRRR